MPSLPDLKLVGKGTKGKSRYNLARFLYERPSATNGKKIDVRWFFKKIETGELRSPKVERVPLVQAIHEELQFRLDSGAPLTTIDSIISGLQTFFDFCTSYDLELQVGNAEKRYFDFCEYLYFREAKGEILVASAYGLGAKVSGILCSILDVPEPRKLIKRTRLKYPHAPLKTVGLAADKQNLSDTNKLGTFCFHLCRGLTPETILGSLPLQIVMPSEIVAEGTVELLNPQQEQTLKAIKRHENRKGRSTTWRKHGYDESKAVFEPLRSIEGTRRYYYVNLRVVCEFLLFLAQTGCNISVAENLTSEKFKYKPTSDGFRLRAYKNRRGGEVELDIFSSYKAHLKGYLAFLATFFPDSKLLFPIYSYKHQGEFSSRITFTAIRKLLSKHDIPWTPASVIRKTRVNWILRRSADEGLTADMHDHTIGVMKARYEKPSLQKGLVEISKFWNENSPLGRDQVTTSIIASTCSGKPRSTDDKPPQIVEPNCTYPSGCLWCENHRDRNSFDYVWSLVSLRQLKSLEASSSVSKTKTASDLVIDRVTQKVDWFREHGEKGKEWVDEAELRMEEGDYHPNFSSVIEFLEY